MISNPRVLHVASGRTLNLTLPDLGVPDMPDLWGLLRAAPIAKGDLLCPDGVHNGVPAPMYLQMRGSLRLAAHYRRGDRKAHPPAGESDLHKVWKERIAIIAEGEGLTPHMESRAGKNVISDVEITGGTRSLSVEVELKKSTPESVMQRSRRRFERGMQPLWLTDNPDATFLYRVPGAATPRQTSWRTAADLHTQVVAGVRTVRGSRCGRNGLDCPRGGKPCGGFHAELEPARVAHFDKLITGAATDLYRELAVPKGRRTHRYWLTTDDWERFVDDRGWPLGGRVSDGADHELRPTLRPNACSLVEQVQLRRARALDEIFRADGTCQAGNPRCGESARFYAAGWYCANHRPGSPVGSRR